MKLTWEKGRKSEKDRIIKMTSEKEEPFSIYKIALLVNQVAINELNIYGEVARKNFFFKKAIIESIEMAEEGLDWGQEENKDEVKKWSKKYLLQFEKIEQELRKNYQSKLNQF